MKWKGKVYFVPYVLPGELVRIGVSQEKKSYGRGRVLEILESSSLRRKADCPYYGLCGGCNLLHLPYPQQLSLKENLVREQFEHLAQKDLGKDFYFEPSQEQGYRNRAQFHGNQEGQKGFKRAQSQELVPLKGCPLLVPPLNDFLASPAPLTGERETFFAWGGRAYRSQEEVKLSLKGKTLGFQARMFFQSNLSTLPALLSYALQDAHGKKAWDLYCGVGLFSAFLLDTFQEVWGVEIDGRVQGYYKENTQGRARFVGKDAATWLKNQREGPDFVLLDPPRGGISPALCQALKEKAPRRLVYLSCNPVTQARDLGRLQYCGYRLLEARGFDFYPQTAHMEMVAHLGRVL